MDSHSFFADPDQAVFLNADPDPDPGSLKFVKKRVEKYHEKTNGDHYNQLLSN